MISESVVESFAVPVRYDRDVSLYLFCSTYTGACLYSLPLWKTTYVISGKEIYKNITKFWGKLFGINFALGVTTGLTMAVQFGTNGHITHTMWGICRCSNLAIEGLMAFFLKSTFIGLFFFGWDRLSKVQRLCVTWLVALGSNMSPYGFGCKWLDAKPCRFCI